jgi:hypothetical protein
VCGKLLQKSVTYETTLIMHCAPDSHQQTCADWHDTPPSATTCQAYAELCRVELFDCSAQQSAVAVSKAAKTWTCTPCPTDAGLQTVPAGQPKSTTRVYSGQRGAAPLMCGPHAPRLHPLMNQTLQAALIHTSTLHSWPAGAVHDGMCGQHSPCAVMVASAAGSSLAVPAGNPGLCSQEQAWQSRTQPLPATRSAPNSWGPPAVLFTRHCMNKRAQHTRTLAWQWH